MGHLFFQGPNTADLNNLVDTCATVNEAILQLVLQVVIIMKSDKMEPVSTLQYVVIATSLIMASKGQAEGFLALKLKNKKGLSSCNADLFARPFECKKRCNYICKFNCNDRRTNVTCKNCSVKLYHEMGLGEKLPMIGK